MNSSKHTLNSWNSFRDKYIGTFKLGLNLQTTISAFILKGKGALLFLKLKGIPYINCFIPFYSNSLRSSYTHLPYPF